MKTLKVNLIEDDSDDTLIIKDMLAECADVRFQVKASDTLSGAMALLEQDQPDLILLDLSLPDAVGLDALKQVRAAAPAADLIILTGNTDSRMGLEALKHGASDYLVKGRIDSILLARTILFSQERRKLEEQLRQAHKLEAIGKLAGGIAHDFNNQLGIMNLLVGEIMEQNKNSDLESSISNLNSVIEKCGQLVTQILAFSRKQVLITEAVDVNAVLQDVVPLMQRMVGSQIQVVFTACELNCVIQVDRGQFEQVLWNLVINAKDAIGKHGRISIHTILEKTNRGDFVVIDIGDNGPGIPKEVLPNIFDPFFTTKAQGEGTGLGLATVLGIMQQSHANIDIATEIGTGTTFRLTFPASESAPVAKATPKTGQFVAHKNVLVCDDEQMLLELISDVLESSDMTVFKANSGAEALELFKANPQIDLVITDLTMPHMDGKRLGKEIEKINPSVKVIYISGYAPITNASVDLVKNSKYLSKPFTKQSLLSIVAEILQVPA